jgi:hypothetical protein
MDTLDVMLAAYRVLGGTPVSDDGEQTIWERTSGVKAFKVLHGASFADSSSAVQTHSLSSIRKLKMDLSLLLE